MGGVPGEPTDLDDLERVVAVYAATGFDGFGERGRIVTRANEAEAAAATIASRFSGLRRETGEKTEVIRLRQLLPAVSEAEK